MWHGQCLMNALALVALEQGEHQQHSHPNLSLYRIPTGNGMGRGLNPRQRRRTDASTAVRHPGPAGQIPGLRRVRKGLRLIERLRKAFADLAIRYPWAQKIGPQEFAEWRRILRIAAHPAQFAGE